MARHRPRVPNETKRVLIEQTAGKCANPGCPNRLVELHHIREWHTYETHDAAHMIAVCGACHDAIHRGELRIADEDLYRWKGIPRTTPPTAHLFVEPGTPPTLLVGSFAVRGESGLAVFDFAGHHRLSFTVRERDIMLLNVKVSDYEGRPLLDVVDGYIRQKDPTFTEFEVRPGRVCARSSIRDQRVVPEWARQALLREDLLFGLRGLPLLDLEVLRPGVVRVKGVWIDQNRGVVITDDRTSFLSRGRPRPITLMGQGEETVIHYNGPIDSAVFGV